MPDDTIEARARRAAEEVAKLILRHDWKLCEPDFTRPFNCVNYDDCAAGVNDVAAIIVREMEGVK